MARALVRLSIGLVMMVALALMLSPFLSSARAATPEATLGQAPQSLTVTLPTVTVTRPATTVTFPTFTIPPTSAPIQTTVSTVPHVATTRPRSTTSTSSTSTSSTTSTTLAQLPAAAPPPVTLPLATAAQSGNINAFFPILSGIGFLTLICLLIAQWVLTRPGYRGPTL